MKKTIIAMAVASAVASPAFAASFVNGGFEAGDLSGWDVSTRADRSGVNNAGLTPAFVYANQDGVPHTSIIANGAVDPRVGAAIGALTYNNSNFSVRVEDTTNGGYASAIRQTVTNYTDPNIFFAWKAVLLGAHGRNDAATMKIVLRDETTSTDLITREYNAASGGAGVDARFSLLSNNYYTAAWQVESLAIDASLSGHDFTLTVLASDCQPTGHWGYVYLDGFSNRNIAVPEPGSLALVGMALAGVGFARRRKSA